MLQSIGYAVAYTGVGIVLLILGFYALDLLTPGHLGRHIYEDRSVNAAITLAAGFLGQGAIVFASIWTNATSGFGRALLYTVVFGVLGVVLQAVAFLVLFIGSWIADSDPVTGKEVASWIVMALIGSGLTGGATYRTKNKAL